MNFNNTPPKWDEQGTEPSAELQEKGFTAGYKPPAPYFNYMFNKYTECLKELQNLVKNETVNADKWTCVTTVGKWSRICKLKGYANYLLTIGYSQTGQAVFYTYALGTGYCSAYISQIGTAGHNSYANIQLRVVQGSNDEEYYLEVYNNFGADGAVTVNCQCGLSMLNGRTNAAITTFAEYTAAEDNPTIREEITSQPKGVVSDLFYGDLTGNAATADKLKEAMQLQIGESTKELDGTGKVAFSPTEIGYRYEWTNPIKCATWSRLCQVKLLAVTVGAKYLLNICATRSGVIYNDTFIVTTHHSKDGNIIKIAGHNYSSSIGHKIRVLSSTSGHGYIDIYDDLVGATSDTTQEVMCRLIPIACGEVIPYTAFTSGENVPTDYKIVSELTIDNSDMQVGDMQTGNVLAETSTTDSRKVSVGNSLHKGTLSVNSDGVFGVYDTTHSKYLLKSDKDGKVTLEGNATTATKADAATKATQDADGNEIAQSYVPMRKWYCKTTAGSWSRICRIKGYSSHILSIGIVQNNQAVTHTYIIGTGYSSATISQIGNTGHSGNAAIELRVVMGDNETDYYVEMLNAFNAATDTDIVIIECGIIKLDKDASTVTTFTDYTATAASVSIKASIISRNKGLVSDSIYDGSGKKYINETDVVDNLISTSTTLPLSAYQGKLLKDEITQQELTWLPNIGTVGNSIPTYITKKAYKCGKRMDIVYHGDVTTDTKGKAAITIPKLPNGKYFIHAKTQNLSDNSCTYSTFVTSTTAKEIIVEGLGSEIRYRLFFTGYYYTDED